MTLRGRKYTRAEATAKARQLDATAFAKRAVDSPLRERCQILIEDGRGTYLVASGPTWARALEDLYNWVAEHRQEEAHGQKEARG
jgi:hypothetical protein